MQLVRQGLSIAKIAKATGRGMTTINRHLRALNLKTSRGARPDWRFALTPRQRSEAVRRYSQESGRGRFP